MLNPIFKENIQGQKHPKVSLIILKPNFQSGDMNNYEPLHIEY